MVLLTLVFAGAVVAAARPTGLPSAAGESGTGQPEDIMLCVGGPITDRATGAMLRYFSEQVKTFDTQRIGLTSPNRRVIPLTRDHQYAAAQLAGYAQAPNTHATWTAGAGASRPRCPTTTTHRVRRTSWRCA